MKIPSENIESPSIFSTEPVKADIHFFSKAFNKNELEMAKGCEFVIYDLCDDWFIQKNRDQLARDFISLADIVTCPTRALADRILAETRVRAEIIGDPCEFPEAPPKDQTDLRLLWFGHPSNLDFDVHKYPNLEIVTLTKPLKKDGITLTPWSLDNLKKAFERNNVVIIPGKKAIKSPNRLIEALRSGLYVIASRTSSYLEFEDFTTLNDTIPLDVPRETSKILKGQEYIRDNYTPEIIGRKWNQLFASI